MNLFSPRILKRLTKKYKQCDIDLPNRIKTMYTKYGPEINELLDLDDLLYSCLSKYLDMDLSYIFKINLIYLIASLYLWAT